VWVKKFHPLSYSEIFSKRLKIFNQNFTRLLYVHIYGKLLNFIVLSVNLTELCHIKHNHSVSEFSLFTEGQLYRLHRKGWMATKFTRPQPTWLSCVVWGCNASGISQTSLKAQDYYGTKKYTAAELGWLAADNDQQSYNTPFTLMRFEYGCTRFSGIRFSASFSRSRDQFLYVGGMLTVWSRRLGGSCGLVRFW